MDLEALAKGFAALKMVIDTIRSLIPLMPDTGARREAQLALEQAERQLKTAEANAATALRYQICRNHFPPEVMLSADNSRWECPVCHSKRLTNLPGDENPSKKHADIL